VRLIYDLRYATDHFPGIGTHARALAGALLERGRVDSVTLLWDPSARNTRFDLEPLRRHPRARWLDVDVPALATGTAHGTGRILARLPADVFLSPFWLRPEGARIPCVLTVHDVLPLALPRLTNLPKRWAYAWAMRRAAGAAAVLTSSRFSRDEILRRTRIPAERLHVIPLGIARVEATPERPAGAPPGPFALTVGANRPHKGLETLARVWRGFAGSPPLALVGAGANAPGRFSLAQLSREVNGVHALGYVPPAELEWLYRNATLVLVPSRYEGFGLPLLEAAARGAPVVASDIPALREIGEGVARFVASDDASAWARAIRELSGDDPARERMRADGIARAAEYDYDRCAGRVEGVLVKLGQTTQGAAA
jgi:glycosyltransferase involved in cell wall biosynthesis